MEWLWREQFVADFGIDGQIQVVETFDSVDALALNAVRSAALSAHGGLAAGGKPDWPLAILTPTKKLTRLISDAFRVKAGQLPAIPHEAVVEMDAAILGAEVVAFLMQPVEGSGAARDAGFHSSAP